MKPATDPDDNFSQHGPDAHIKMPVQARPVALPDVNPKTRYGRAKPGLSSTPFTALLYLGRVFELGASKYGAFNWRDDEVSASVYYDAALRHMACYFDGQVNDEESGQPHLAHVMACCAILIDAEAHGKLLDDRPKGGKIAAIIKALTRPI